MEIDLKMEKDLVSVSHMTSKLPYPRVIRVKFHAFTLIRGVL
jgi:hypothetical protein